MFHNHCFDQKNKKTIKHFLLNIFTFYNFGKICILHGLVFVMYTQYDGDTFFIGTRYVSGGGSKLNTT